MEQIEDIIMYIENDINRKGISEIQSDTIGEMVMDKLKDVDEVAYVRFASVYRQFKDINTLFRKKEKLTLTEIKSYLLEQKYIYTEKELMFALNSLFIERGVIVRDDFWDHEPIYTRIDKRRELSSYSKHYYSFNVDNCETKKFLLIADTHIGNEEIEDFKMLDKLYDYAIKEGVNKCFHLGDLFTGDINGSELDVFGKLEQINKFIDNYPRPLSTEMMTYGLLGNNDLEIDNMLWHDGFSDIYYDLRELFFVNSSFYMIPRESWTTNFLDKSFHFGHKFHHSVMLPNLKITCVNDLLEQKKWLDWHYNVQISGHLHNGLIYGAEPSDYVNREQLFLGVPSTGRQNINNSVAYLVILNYKSETEITDMDIEILGCDSNYCISKLDTLNWSFVKKNNLYSKKKVRVL